MVDRVVQLDIRSHELGILAAHPVTPLVCLHHLDFIPEIFPKTTTKTFTKVEAVKYLLDAATVDPASILQQSICYDRKAGVVNSCFLGLCCWSVQRVHKSINPPKTCQNIFVMVLWKSQRNIVLSITRSLSKTFYNNFHSFSLQKWDIMFHQIIRY